MKFKTKLKKAFISFLCSFTFMSVISFPKMTAKVNAQGLDINTAFQQIIGSHISENQWHYSFNGGQHFDEVISNTNPLASADDYYKIGLDCTAGTLAVVARAIKNAGEDPLKYFGDCRGQLNLLMPEALSQYFTNMETVWNGGAFPDVSDLQEGDILVYQNKHMNVYAGNGKTIDFASNGKGSKANYSGFAYYIHYKTNSGSGEESANLSAVYRINLNKTITYAIVKNSILPNCSNNNPMYKFDGVKVGVYLDPNCTQQIDTLVTNTLGQASGQKEVNSSVNTIYMKELDANTAHTNLEYTDTKVHTVILNNNHGISTFSNKPINDPFFINIKKVDAEGKTYIPSLENAIFEVKYYPTLNANNVSDVANLKPLRTWYFKTLKDGNKYLSKMNFDKYFSHGDTLYRNEKNEIVYPLGSYTVQEKQAPSAYTVEGGYLQSDDVKLEAKEIFFAKIDKAGQQPNLQYGNKLSDPNLQKKEKPIRGTFTIQKQDEDVLVDPSQSIFQSKRSQGDASFANAEFDLYYLNNGIDNTSSMKIDTDGDGLGDSKEYLPGEKIAHIVLDESGYYKAPNKTYLAYGNYKLVEVKAPKGYAKAKDITFSLKQNEQVINTNAVEKVYQGNIQITKTINMEDVSDFTRPEKDAVFTIVLKRYAQEVANKKGHSTIQKQDILDAYDQRNNFISKDLSTHSVSNMTNMEFDEIRTNAIGIAKSKALAYGDYVLVQRSGVKESQLVKRILNFSIYSKAQETQYFSATNNIKDYVLKIQKKDLDTGKAVTFTSSAWKIKMLKDAFGNDVSHKTDTDLAKRNRLVDGYITQTLGDVTNQTTYDVFMTASTNDPKREQGVFYGSSNGQVNNQLSMTTIPLSLKAGEYQLEEVITSDGFITSRPIKA